MSLASVDEKLLAFYILEIFNDCSLSIEAKDMILLPFNASLHDDSGKLWFIFLQLLGDELTRLNLQKKCLPGDF